MAARGARAAAPTNIPRIGVIDQSPIWDHFRRGLNELGYVDGRDIVIEYRSAQGQPDQLAAVASELAGLSVDVIVTSGSAATHAAQQATTTIPIVMIAFSYIEEWRAVAPKLGVEPLLVELSRSDQLETAFAAMMRERPDALSVTADPFHLSQIGWIIDFVAKNRLPAIYVVKENVVAGGLMSYGPSLPDLYRRAAG
jgi:putative tryptophan/tyrosine transport system substrate-binding protein